MESSTDDLSKYLSQLNEVSEQLADPNCQNQNELVGLQTDLVEIINIMQKDQPTIELSSDDDSVVEISDDFDDLEGSPCKVKHFIPGFALTCHRAVIQEAKVDDENNITVRIDFTHPLCKMMKTCPHYLSNCQFGTKCKFSHGLWFPMSRIQPFEMPNFEDVQTGSLCLVHKTGSEFWSLARVTSICLDEQKLAAQQLETNEELAFAFGDIFPIDNSDLEPITPDDIDVEEVAGPSTTFDMDSDEIIFDGTFAQKHQRAWVHDSLGTWESHTKGIGSKLMAKMGYQVGKGLGRDNSGRIDPIEPKVLPKRTSLDRCSDDRLKLLRLTQQNKNLTIDSKNKHNRRNNVFKFINKSVASRGNSKQNDKPLTHKTLQEIGDKDLNVKLLVLQDKIRLQEGPVVKKHSLTPATASKISSMKHDAKLLADEIKNRKSRKTLMNF